MRLEDLINTTELSSASDSDISDVTKLLLKYFPRNDVMEHTNKMANKLRRLKWISLGVAAAEVPIFYAVWNLPNQPFYPMSVFAPIIVHLLRSYNTCRRAANIYEKINKQAMTLAALPTDRIYIKKPEYIMNLDFLEREEKIREVADIAARHSRKSELIPHFEALIANARKYAKIALGVTAAGILPLAYFTATVPQMLILDFIVASAGIGTYLSYKHSVKINNIFIDSAKQAAH